MEMGFNDYRAFDAHDVEAALRPLGWSELCARLVAAQDYRRALAAPDGPAVSRNGSSQLRLAPAPDVQTDAAPGSFHSGTARMLEHFEKGNRAINPDSSTYGKDKEGTQGDSRQTSLSAFAERQADENRHD